MSPPEFDKIFSDFKAQSVDVKAFTREFLYHAGGMPGLAKLLYQEIQNAPEGSMARTGLLKQAVELIKVASVENRAADVIAEMDEDELKSVVKDMLGGRADVDD